MNREEAHKLVDDMFDRVDTPEPGEKSKPDRVLPEGKRVVRSKSTGDRVFLFDDTAMTKAWVTSPEILAKLGFEMGDVVDVEDSEFIRYAMAPSIYRVE